MTGKGDPLDSMWVELGGLRNEPKLHVGEILDLMAHAERVALELDAAVSDAGPPVTEGEKIRAQLMQSTIQAASALLAALLAALTSTSASLAMIRRRESLAVMRSLKGPRSRPLQIARDKLDD